MSVLPVIWKMLYKTYIYYINKLLNSNSENFRYFKIALASHMFREMEIVKRRLKKATDDVNYI